MPPFHRLKANFHHFHHFVYFVRFTSFSCASFSLFQTGGNLAAGTQLNTFAALKCFGTTKSLGLYFFVTRMCLVNSRNILSFMPGICL